MIAINWPMLFKTIGALTLMLYVLASLAIAVWVLVRSWPRPRKRR